MNSLIFSLLHFQFEDLYLGTSVLKILTKFGISLVLIWVVVNFGLLYSILLHTFINLTAMVILILSYELATQKDYLAETNDFIMSCKRVSLFGNNSTVLSNDSKGSFDSQNSTISSVFDYYCPNNKLEKLYFGKFNIKIRRKNTSKEKLKCEDIELLIRKAGIESD